MITVELYPDEYLLILRTRLEMTQSQLAKRLGVNRATIMRYETGQSRVPTDWVDRVKQLEGAT